MLNANKSANWSLDVPVATSFAAPRTTINDSLTIYDSNDWIVVVHEVATWNVVVPKASVRALSCSAWSSHEIALSFASNHRGMHEHRAHLSCCKSIGHHQSVVQAVVPLRPCLSEERNLAFREVCITPHSTAKDILDIVNGILITSILHPIDAMVAATTIEHTNLFAIIFPIKMVVNGHLEEQIFWLLFQSKRRKRRDELLVICFIKEAYSQRMSAYLIVKCSCHYSFFFSFFLGFSISMISCSIYSSGLKRNSLLSTRIILSSLLLT